MERTQQTTPTTIEQTVAPFQPGYLVHGLHEMYQGPDGAVAITISRPTVTYTLGTDELGRYLRMETPGSAFKPLLPEVDFPATPGQPFPDGPMLIVRAAPATDQ